MLIENEKVNRDKYYLVGYSPVLNKYILACVVTWVGWYHRYYEISEEEYLSFDSSELDSLAENLYKQGCHSERFLFSEKKEENNQKQLDLWRNLCYNKEC
jgi:hypothetical protein